MMCMKIQFYPKLPRLLKKSVWNILCESSYDFVPPLSERYNEKGVEEFDVTKVKIEKYPFSYFNKIKSLAYLIAFDEKTNEVMGFTAFLHGFYMKELKECNPSNYISTTCVSKKFRNRGVAQKLYHYFEEELPPSYQLPYITRRTWSTNQTQIHLYTKKGFFPAYTLKNDRGNEIDTVYYVKRITSSLDEGGNYSINNYIVCGDIKNKGLQTQ